MSRDTIDLADENRRLLRAKQAPPPLSVLVSVASLLPTLASFSRSRERRSGACAVRVFSEKPPSRGWQ